MGIARPTRRAAGWIAAALLAGAVFFSQAAAAAADFGVELFDAPALNEAGQAETQAAAHPFGSNARVNLTKTGSGEFAEPTEALKDITVNFPPGVLGNPQAVPKCSPATFADTVGTCPVGTQVGIAANDSVCQQFGGCTSGVYNLEPRAGTVAQFGFKIVGLPVILTARVRPGDHGVSISSSDITSISPVTYSSITFWGVPGDTSHDAFREGFPSGNCLGDLTEPKNGYLPCWPGAPAGAPRKPFLSSPNDCAGGPYTTSVEVTSWEHPNDVKTATTVSHDSAEPPNPTGVTGCDVVPFDPTLSVQPTANTADSPTGLNATLHLPQEEDPDGLSTAYVKRAVVDLPKGVTVNPSSAAGLGACTPAQIGLVSAVGNPAARFDDAAAACPSDSRIGSVEVDSPAVDHPLPGSVYLAAQNQNPFGSLLALYLVIDDPKTGVRVKLAGQVDADAASGQLRASFNENPQLPFEDLKVSLFEGPRAPLKTAVSCGSFTASSELTPWTAPEGATKRPSGSFTIGRGAGGGACVSSESEAPNAPAFNAGTIDPTAGAYSPFVLKLTRNDGSQQLKGIDATLPKGLLGKLAGIPYCSDAALAAAAARSGRSEQSSPSCPSASQVGSVTVGAGAGSLPLYVPGKAYLAGPYKGAPLSLAIVTPAVAGPFDLGTVVVRTRLEVDPETARIHAVSDDIPTILQGIPLDVRSIAVKLDKPSFTLNPTSCAKSQVLAGATALLGGTASVSSPFQVGGCGALGFKPKLSIDLKGGTKRGQHPALKAVLSARPGDANIGKAVVSLPHSEFLAQDHIKTICTRVQFAADQCPAGSVYGRVRAISPLLEQPLEGPVYLRSSSNPLPDLVADLQGQIEVVVVGRIDSKRGGIRTSFETVPDAPVSKFVIEMAGAKKSLLENSRNLCRSTNRADVKLDGQNGKAADSRPVITNDCRKKKRKGKKHKSKAKAGKHGTRR